MMTSSIGSVQRRVALVYDIKNCGPNHRFVANGKLVHNSGADKVNLQNLPRGGALRKAMRAPTGYCLCVSDSSQIEARTLAWFAGQTDLVDEFKHGVDVYSSFATTVYGYQVTKKEHPVERHVGKTCLAGNTLVLTDKGYKLITDVTEKDRLWDGFDWVKHDGVVPMGEKKVVQFAGLRATKDHMIFTGYDTWIEWQQFIEDKDVRKKALNSANLPVEAFALQPWLRKRRLWTRTFTEPVYDIANAGPRHRFTVLTDRGPLIVHNCILGLGYGTGASKLHSTMRKPSALCRFTVSATRASPDCGKQATTCCRPCMKATKLSWV